MGYLYTDSVNVAGNYWWPNIPSQPSVMPDRPTYDIQVIDKKEMREEQPMRNLFQVVIVNPKTEKVITSQLIVAKDRESALLKVAKQGIEINPEEFDIIVQFLGNVRARKEVQEVKVVEEEA